MKTITIANTVAFLFIGMLILVSSVDGRLDYDIPVSGGRITKKTETIPFSLSGRDAQDASWNPWLCCPVGSHIIGMGYALWDMCRPWDQFRGAYYTSKRDDPDAVVDSECAELYIQLEGSGQCSHRDNPRTDLTVECLEYT